MHTTVVQAASSGGSLLVPAPADLLWGIVSFVVLFILFWRYALPRLQTLLDERAKAIGGRLDEAKHAREEAEALRDQYQQQLADARAEAGKIREQAREDGKRIVAEARQQAQVEAERVTAQQQVQIEANRAAAEQGLRTEVGTLALSLASAVVEQHLADDANAKAYVERFLDDLRIEHAPDGSPQTGGR